MSGRLVVLFALLLLATPVPLLAQSASTPPAAKGARVGYLLLSPLADRPSPARAAFIDGMKDAGYTVGQNLTIEYRSAYLRAEFLPGLVEELVEAKVDVIFAVATPAAQAATATTKTVPIVFAGVSDPLAAGLVASLARPGGNATGLTFINPELAGKRLSLLKQMVPQASRVGVLWNPDNASTVREWQEMQAGARRLGLTLDSIEIRRAADLEPALAALTRLRPDGLAVSVDPLTTSIRPFVVEHAAAQRLPAIYGMREFADAGGLISYGPSLPASFRAAAGYVARILHGARPSTLPVQRPSTFELVVNLRTAEALGLTIPPAVLVQADEVIK